MVPLFETNKAVNARVFVRLALPPLTLASALQMVLFRLRVAGRNEPLIDDEAFEVLYEKSQGVPREIIRLCALATDYLLQSDSPWSELRLRTRSLTNDEQPWKQQTRLGPALRGRRWIWRWSRARPAARLPLSRGAKVGFTLSQGEIRELEAWQDRFSRLLNRKVSTGETIGILVRICTARNLRLAEASDASAEAAEPAALVDLVARMIGA